MNLNRNTGRIQAQKLIFKCYTFTIGFSVRFNVTSLMSDLFLLLKKLNSGIITITLMNVYCAVFPSGHLRKGHFSKPTELRAGSGRFEHVSVQSWRVSLARFAGLLHLLSGTERNASLSLPDPKSLPFQEYLPPRHWGAMLTLNILDLYQGCSALLLKIYFPAKFSYIQIILIFVMSNIL